MVPGHRLTEIIIWVNNNENRVKDAGDIEHTKHSKVKHMTLNCDLDIESVGES